MSCFDFMDVTKDAIDLFKRQKLPAEILLRFAEFQSTRKRIISFGVYSISKNRLVESLTMLQPSIKFATPQGCDPLKFIFYFIYFSEVRNCERDKWNLIMIPI